MAKRYSGQVVVSLTVNDHGIYKGNIKFPGGSWAFDGLRLSPVDQRRIAIDSAEAYDVAAEAAISFATNDHEDIFGYVLPDPSFPNESRARISRTPPRR